MLVPLGEAAGAAEENVVFVFGLGETVRAAFPGAAIIAFGIAAAGPSFAFGGITAVAVVAGFRHSDNLRPTQDQPSCRSMLS